MSGGNNGNVVGDITLKDSLNTGPVTSGGGGFRAGGRQDGRVFNVNYGGTQKNSSATKVADPVSSFEPMDAFTSPTQNTGLLVAVAVGGLLLVAVVLKKKRGK